MNVRFFEEKVALNFGGTTTWSYSTNVLNPPTNRNVSNT
jgi:hypothetical protein